LQRQARAFNIAYLYHVHISAARPYQYHELDLFPFVSLQILVLMREMNRKYQHLVKAVRDEDVQGVLTHLQDTQHSAIDARLYNPCHDSQDLYEAGNPWYFNIYILRILR
jgi:hypothetical protein